MVVLVNKLVKPRDLVHDAVACVIRQVGKGEAYDEATNSVEERHLLCFPHNRGTVPDYLNNEERNEGEHHKTIEPDVHEGATVKRSVGGFAMREIGLLVAPEIDQRGAYQPEDFRWNGEQPREE